MGHPWSSARANYSVRSACMGSRLRCAPRRQQARKRGNREQHNTNHYIDHRIERLRIGQKRAHELCNGRGGPRPSTSPRNAGRSPSNSIRRRTSPRRAPSAMRTPISVVRWVTRNDSTPKRPTAASTSDRTAKGAEQRGLEAGLHRGLTDHFVHGHYVGDGQVAVYGCNHALYWFCHGGGIAGGAHGERDGALGAREKREVEGWKRISRGKLTRVSDDADDLEGGGFRTEDGCDDVLADRVFAFEVFACQAPG